LHRLRLKRTVSMASLFARAEDHPGLIVAVLEYKYFAEDYAQKIQKEHDDKLRAILNSWWGIKEGPKMVERSGGIISAVGRTSVWVDTPGGPLPGEWREIYLYEFAPEYEHLRPLFDHLMDQQIGTSESDID